MTDDPFFADSAGHTLIDIEAAGRPQTAANDAAPPVPQPVETLETDALPKR